ncbi:stretch-activated cation channel Mid1 [Melanogaster broomeanus]|nr:stretch-activated cation channel Mid1 [Melanogaster broomeanus]
MRVRVFQLCHLSETLLCLLHVSLALAQAQQALPLNSVTSFSSSTSPSLFGLPSSSQLTVSVAICSSQALSARFFLTNSTSGINPGPGGGSDVFEIPLNTGYGQWSGSAPVGGLMSVQDLQGSFEVSVSDDGTTYGILDQLPQLGDTTANQAILFSHAFYPPTIEQPSYPNYTLPPANLSTPDGPPSTPTFNLVIGPTSSQLSSLPQTACTLLNTSSTGSIISNDLWLRDNDGWRSQWLVDGLSPSTNYTAYVIQDQLKVSGPIYFATKSAGFPCPLVHSLPYCPSTAYAVPLPQPPTPALAYDATSLPSTISTPLLQYMTNFTTMLLTFACGRDLYSPLQTCADCQRQYRSWLCTVSFPRCSEPAPTSTTSSPGNNVQSPFSALQPQASGSTPRNPFFPKPSYAYTSLLPCLETCNAVDRACPYSLGIKCPIPQFNADASYGVGFIDNGEVGVTGQGSTGVAQDTWGNVWCNAS